MGPNRLRSCSEVNSGAAIQAGTGKQVRRVPARQREREQMMRRHTAARLPSGTMLRSNGTRAHFVRRRPVLSLASWALAGLMCPAHCPGSDKVQPLLPSPSPWMERCMDSSGPCALSAHTQRAQAAPGQAEEAASNQRSQEHVQGTGGGRRKCSTAVLCSEDALGGYTCAHEHNFTCPLTCCFARQHTHTCTQTHVNTRLDVRACTRICRHAALTWTQAWMKTSPNRRRFTALASGPYTGGGGGASPSAAPPAASPPPLGPPRAPCKRAHVHACTAARTCASMGACVCPTLHARPALSYSI